MLLKTTITVNGQARALSDLDPRTTLLDALREELDLKGTQEGLRSRPVRRLHRAANGVRINSCLSLAVMHDGDAVTTIEGVGTPDALHPSQQAFLKETPSSAGHCTPGETADLGMLKEVADNWPSQATQDLVAKIEPTDAEIRERMSGNLCRCSAYPQILRRSQRGGGRRMRPFTYANARRMSRARSARWRATPTPASWPAAPTCST